MSDNVSHNIYFGNGKIALTVNGAGDSLFTPQGSRKPATAIEPSRVSSRQTGRTISVCPVNKDSFHRIYVSANLYLTELENCVREGRVQEAFAFSKFICNSGICSLMQENPETNPQLASVMPYNGMLLWEHAQAVRQMCCDFWSKRTAKLDGTAKGIPVSEVTKLNDKIDVLAMQLAKLSQPKTRKRKMPAASSIVELSQSGGVAIATR